MVFSPDDISLHLIPLWCAAHEEVSGLAQLPSANAVFGCSVPRCMRSATFCLPSSSAPRWGPRSKKLTRSWWGNGKWVTHKKNKCSWVFANYTHMCWQYHAFSCGVRKMLDHSKQLTRTSIGSAFTDWSRSVKFCSHMKKLCPKILPSFTVGFLPRCTILYVTSGLYTVHHRWD